MAPRTPHGRNHRSIADIFPDRRMTAGLLGAALGASVVLVGATPALAAEDVAQPVAAEDVAAPADADPSDGDVAAADETAAADKGVAAGEAKAADKGAVAGEAADDAASGGEATSDGAAAAGDPSPTAAAQAPAADASREVGSVIYNGTEGSLRGDGAVAHGTSVSATDTATGATMATGWNNDSAILDLTKSGAAFEGHVRIENATDERLRVEEIVMLNRFAKTAGQLSDPYRPDVVVDGSRVRGDSLKLGLDDEETLYSVEAGRYLTLDQLRAADPGFSWDRLIAIMAVGYLDARASLDTAIPLRIANYDAIRAQVESIADGTADKALASAAGSRTFDLGAYCYYWRGGDFRTVDSAGSSVAVGAPSTAFMDAVRRMTRGEARWDATVMTTDEDGTRIYDPAPREVQDALKPLSYSDFIFVNRGVAGDVLYTDGSFDIKLENAFDSIKDLGYTVNILPDGSGIWPYYSYTTSDRDSSVIRSNGVIYLQVSRVFDTRDLSLDRPGPWDAADNLLSAVAERYDRGTMRLAGTEDLAADGDYGFELFDADGNLVASGRGDGHVDRLAPGTYTVRYSYAIDPTHVVTKTATVTVADPDAATDTHDDPQPGNDRGGEPSATPDPATPAEPDPDGGQAHAAGTGAIACQATAPDAMGPAADEGGAAVSPAVARTAAGVGAVPRLGDGGWAFLLGIVAVLVAVAHRLRALAS
ncbi:hypothetical protein [Caniella muris]|uniref:hypothetical protein n=1 Tax=Caniella muris TaxID=2941502 RepID=UPI00203ADE4B|nr:hypothetical protein [Caniella muris]